MCSLAKQSEFQQRMQLETIITPTPVTTMRPQNIPKDLTASLIDSNLKEMNLCSTTSKNFPNSPLQMNQNSKSTFSNPYLQSSYQMNSINVPSSTNINQIRPNLSNNLSATSFVPTNSGLSPAAFFTNSFINHANSLQPASMPSSQPAKQLTSSEINDFLN